MSEALPDYSVLMSVYQKDKPEYLNLAIKSMVEQTLPFNDMVIVCDGPLTKPLDEVLAQWREKLGAKVAVHRLAENGGLGSSLSAGLSICKCGIVARMDSDDVSRPDRCEKLVRKMASESLDLVGGAIEEFDKEPGDMGVVRVVPMFQAEIANRVKRRNPFNHMSVVFAKDAVEKAGGYQPFPWMEDYWLWARMIAGGCRCGNVADVVVDVRTGEGMYGRRSNAAYLKSQVRFFSELRKLGLISPLDQAIAVSQRAVATVLPASAVKFAYNKLLRGHL